MGVDMVQGIVKKVKDVWWQGKVATLLLRDVKGVFPNAMITRVVHNMRMAGVPKEHTDWMHTDLRVAPRAWFSTIMFWRYSPLTTAWTRATPQSVICYEFHNAPLARIDDDSGIYIDEYHVLAIGKNLVETTAWVVVFKGRMPRA
jgi:hypothetical protein